MATDFGVNKDIYLARLANVGCEVSGIEFLPSRTPRKQPAASASPQAPQRPAQLPQLSPIERAEVEELVSELPEGLRAAASKAIELSKRREKQNTTSEGPTP
ncbi:MAG: hypothetical protein Q4C09_10575, partial [Atopobiaceae bacterium]|nr:hypothetical protein [Atopobiaceae bacterium]